MTLHFNQLTGLSYYGIALAIVSIILGIISVVHTIQFRSRIECRFVRIRKPTLTIVYCIFAAIGLLITSPFQSVITIFHLEDEAEQYSQRLLYQEWGFAMLDETVMSGMLLAVAVRCWLLLYAHSYSIAVNDRTWRGAINPTESDSSFWIKHKRTLGSARFVGTIAGIYWLMIFGALCGLSVGALRNDDFDFFNFIDLYFVAIPCVMFLFGLLIYGNAANIFVMKADKFRIIREMQYLAATMLLFIVVHILQSLDTQKLYLMTETIHVLFKFLSAYIQNRWVILKQNEHDAAEYNVVLQLHTRKKVGTKKRKKRMKKASSPEAGTQLGAAAAEEEEKVQEKADVQPLKMVDVLRNRYGFGMLDTIIY